ncbi:MAG TPA: AlkA N-terminal domain-containing protein [Verrucomicrobiae bacterium]|jgi:AraC family transcriptional regulator of adaptative response / DNA-3-methyladenine glycosylase II|nr:AlkA N-terminal domain-containing protein [Verrucomicrobiae bacterium]
MKQLNPSHLYRALLSRDSRFDGLFFVGVTSTGIYCRPICPVKPPKAANCRFYNSAQEAELAGFRPCLRCRPELAPGQAPVDAAQRIAHLVVQRIEEGAAGDKNALESIAAEFKLSSRQIRRIVQKELGAPPIQLLLTRRLLLAKQLLTETKWPVIDVAYASGFSSLRRFNDAFRTRYHMPPTRLRKRTLENPAALHTAETSRLQLTYRPPYDWPGILAFLHARKLTGVEWVTNKFYARTVQLGKAQGWIKITHAENKNTLWLEFSHGLTPVLPALLNRVRSLFDTTAQPEIIARHFARDKILGPLLKANPGLRAPGAFHGFELGWRAILGQQVTVKSATTVAGRFVARFGEPIITPFAELNRLTPEAVKIAGANINQLATLGIVGARCRSILALAQAQIAGELSLDSGNHHDPEETIKRLTNLPGIGPWTAHYIAMRALRWPDAFPKEDVAVRNNLGGVTAKQAEQLSQAWRPWRSYAVLHLWNRPMQTKRSREKRAPAAVPA